MRRGPRTEVYKLTTKDPGGGPTRSPVVTRGRDREHGRDTERTGGYVVGSDRPSRLRSKPVDSSCRRLRAPSQNIKGV